MLLMPFMLFLDEICFICFLMLFMLLSALCSLHYWQHATEHFCNHQRHSRDKCNEAPSRIEKYISGRPHSHWWHHRLRFDRRPIDLYRSKKFQADSKNYSSFVAYLWQRIPNIGSNEVNCVCDATHAPEASIEKFQLLLVYTIK